MLFKGQNDEFLQVEDLSPTDTLFESEIKHESPLSVLWFLDNSSELNIDNEILHFDTGELIFLTEFHKVSVINMGKVRPLRFNRPFYCIIDHDDEVGCKGLLFFGNSSIPRISLTVEDEKKLHLLYQVFFSEMESEKDHLQMEMLQMLLKRLLIICTRLYKKQENYSVLNTQSQDLVREFNFLVEKNFRELHTVNEYAELLHKSPKTLSNHFRRFSPNTPLQTIQNRILLEARRLLRYTDNGIKEVAYDLGFEDIHSFSRFFRKKMDVSPTYFRNSVRKGSFAQQSGSID